jgi:hypothetical protein
VAKAVEHLLSKHKALASTPSTEKSKSVNKNKCRILSGMEKVLAMLRKINLQNDM